MRTLIVVVPEVLVSDTVIVTFLMIFFLMALRN